MHRSRVRASLLKAYILYITSSQKLRFINDEDVLDVVIVSEMKSLRFVVAVDVYLFYESRLQKQTN